MPAKKLAATTSPLPERLRAAREKLGVGQRQLGRICGFGANQINRYESGEQEPSAAAFRILVGILGVSVDYLMGLTDEPTGHTAATDLTYQERQLVEAFRRDSWEGVIRLIAAQIPR